MKGRDGYGHRKIFFPLWEGVTRGLLVRLFLTAILFCVLPALVFASPAVDPALCRALTKHVPQSDFAYESGMDVYGKPVAPADLQDSPHMILPDTIKIPLTLNLAKTLNLNTAVYPYTQLGAGTEAALGMLTVEGDHVLFNDQPLSDPQQDRLAVLCLQPQ